LETNEFGNEKIESSQIINIINGGSDNKWPRFVSHLDDYKFGRYEMEWNNNIDLYSSIFQTLT
jgi:hypothetical protein